SCAGARGHAPSFPTRRSSDLAPEEKSDCGIFAQDYGQAGAIDFFGRRYGLPPALSGHQTYFLWGPRNYSGNCLIVLDDKKEVLRSEEHTSELQSLAYLVCRLL